MFKNTLYHLLIAAVATLPVVAIAGTPRERPNITVCLYDYAEVPDPILAKAQEQATRIVQQTGVDLLWMQCTLNEHGVPWDSHCRRPRGPAALTLLVCPRAMAPKEGLPAGIFGFSLMSEKGAAVSARVFFHRLEELANGPKLRRGPLLGSMMAHEIGHLLLGVNSHSRRGIMSNPWNSITLRRADLGQLGFTREQAAAIRAESLRRLGL